MEPADVVHAYWDRIEGRDWEAVRALLADDVVVEWPASKERMVGAANVVAVNAEYPEGWSIRVLRVVADGAEVVSEVEVPQGADVHRAASFWTVEGGRIVRGREYWTAVGADPSPAWRAPYVERL